MNLRPIAISVLLVNIQEVATRGEEKQGKLHNSYDYSGPTTMDNLIERSSMGETSEIYEEVKRVLADLSGWEGIYWQMEKLDQIAIEKIPDELKQAYSQETYFLRLNLLDRFLQVSPSGQFLIFKSADKGEEITLEFYNMVLNEFYKDYHKYEQQPVNFNEKEMEKCFRKAEKKK